MKQPGQSQLCFFLLVSFCVTGTLALDVALTQAPASTLALKNTAIEIKCEVKGQSLDHLRICWYRETPGKANPEFLVCSYSGLSNTYIYGDFDKTRLDMRKSTFPLAYNMKIKDLQESDSGVYYCMGEMVSKLSFGNGTFITVVESLPTTVPPTTRKPPCKCKKPKSLKELPPGLFCSPVIWAPVAGFAVILIIGLYFLATYTYRVYRRTHMYFRKYSPK